MDNRFSFAPEMQFAYVIRMPNGRYFHKFGKKGRVQTAWHFAGAMMFADFRLAEAKKIVSKLHARQNKAWYSARNGMDQCCTIVGVKLSTSRGCQCHTENSGCSTS